jgi:hypothetical protein
MLLSEKPISVRQNGQYTRLRLRTLLPGKYPKCSMSRRKGCSRQLWYQPRMAVILIICVQSTQMIVTDISDDGSIFPPRDAERVGYAASSRWNLNRTKAGSLTFVRFAGNCVDSQRPAEPTNRRFLRPRRLPSNMTPTGAPGQAG